ncbi:hypothetical protein BKA70DRAFT_1215803 [Coprinopsis sp. MPI-PUGE-AT-0042]|nr:hypothetical protein BKA70DRAFT_1215803 [Coprinopsis sp. MPI-PUGE-AT-0042]
MSSTTTLSLPDITSITVHLGKQRVRIPRRESYEELLETIRFHLPDINATEDITLQTKDVPKGDGKWVDLSPPFWHFIHKTTDNLKVNLSRASKRRPLGSKVIGIEVPELCRTLTAEIKSNDKVVQLMTDIRRRLGLSGDFKLQFKADSLPEFDFLNVWGVETNHTLVLTQGKPPSQITTAGKFRVKVHYDVDYFHLPARPTTSVKKLKDAVSSQLRISPCELRLIAGGVRLDEGDTLAAYGITESQPDVYAFVVQVGGKPVIYVFPPKGTSLEAQWGFSAIYPVVNAKATAAGGQSLCWNITLGWMFRTSIGKQRIDGHRQEQFIPSRPSVDDGNSVLLSLEKLPLYLDHALLALGLDTEARTSFITYWLPSFNKHKHISLRFLPQAAYEASAPLDVLPKPDVVARIFMLFQGVEDCDVEHWLEATLRASQPVNRWQDVVGVDPSRVCDTTLYRVIEWGGMEIRF